MPARAPRASTPSRSRTIPARLHAATLARLAEANPDTLRPHTCAEVARWLGEAHGCPVSRLAVQRLRAASEKHTSAQVTSALREEIAQAVPAILARVQRSTKRLDAAAARSTSTKDLAAATNALTRALHELATLGGVAAPVAVDITSGGQPLEDARVTLAARLAGLAQEPVSDGGGGASAEPPARGG
jgi:hypothetical protein